jgi:hypothetical protein
MRVTLTDGGAGDADGVANGVIVDPGALAVALPRSAPLVSTSRTRAAPRPLSGATVKGSVAIFVPARPEIARVEWYLDDPRRTRKPRLVDRLGPFDFNGTARNGTAVFFSTKTLNDGRHTVTAKVVRRDGKTEYASANFFVSNTRRATSGAAALAPDGAAPPDIDPIQEEVSP